LSEPGQISYLDFIFFALKDFNLIEKIEFPMNL